MALGGSGVSGTASRAGNSRTKAPTAVRIGPLPSRSRSHASAATRASGSASARIAIDQPAEDGHQDPGGMELARGQRWLGLGDGGRGATASAGTRPPERRAPR